MSCARRLLGRDLIFVTKAYYLDVKSGVVALLKCEFQRRQVHMTPEQAAEFYKGHYGRHHFPHLVAHMSSGPVLAMVLAATDAVAKWCTLMGPARLVLEARVLQGLLRATHHFPHLVVLSPSGPCWPWCCPHPTLLPSGDTTSLSGFMGPARLVAG